MWDSGERGLSQFGVKYSRKMEAVWSVSEIIECKQCSCRNAAWCLKRVFSVYGSRQYGVVKKGNMESGQGS
jgi:hypothetical protein